MIIIGTIFHIIIGLGLSFIFSPVAIALFFWFKEVGEAKHKVKGSIKTIKKNLEMVAYPFRPKMLPQWILPGVGAYLLQLAF
ncbi:MAG: hypothetical protein JKY52_00300 [Flavobacteriales bacterium]|nr:hypothetical protein [Flavobacteriales bacterium]